MATTGATQALLSTFAINEALACPNGSGRSIAIHFCNKCTTSMSHLMWNIDLRGLIIDLANVPSDLGH
jgi:hypothetical protein